MGKKMYYDVASKLVVSGDQTRQYSQAVSMAGANAVLINATVLNITGGTLTLMAEEGNDLENWGTLSGQIAFTAGTYNTLKITDIAGQYVRLKYVQSGAFSTVLAAGVNTAQL
jgi:hypothetical protein